MRRTQGRSPEVAYSLRVMLELWDELRAKPGPFLFRMQTSSMWPAVPAGSLLAIRPCPASSLAPGDLVTFRRRGLIVTHRVVRLLEGDRVLSWGDALLRPDAPIPPGDVLGRAELVERGPLLGADATLRLAVRRALAGLKRHGARRA